jgi:hypothetical protein
VQEQASLFTDRLNDFRMAVTRIRYPDAAGEIQQRFAVIRINVRAFRPVGNKVEDAAPGRSHVREIILIELIGRHFFFLVFEKSCR